MAALAGAASEVFGALLKARDRACSLRALRRAHRRGQLRGGPRGAGAPVLLRVQALCLAPRQDVPEVLATSLESRLCRACSPRLPPLVCGLAKCKIEKVCQGVDVVRCRKNALANAPFPLPVFCPASGSGGAAGGNGRRPADVWVPGWGAHGPAAF